MMSLTNQIALPLLNNYHQNSPLSETLRLLRFREATRQSVSDILPTPRNWRFPICDSEVDPDSVIKEYLISAGDGKQCRMKQHNFALNDRQVLLDRSKLKRRDAENAEKFQTVIASALSAPPRFQFVVLSAWVGKLDAFLEFNDRTVLNHAGSIQKKVADQLALEHFDAYSAERRRIKATEPTSDFDRFVDGVKKIKPTRKDGEHE